MYTNNTCQYDSWHKYNLKRKVAELAPVSAQQFAEKLMGKDGVFNVLGFAAVVIVGLLIQLAFHEASQQKGQEEQEKMGLIYECPTCK